MRLRDTLRPAHTATTCSYRHTQSSGKVSTEADSGRRTEKTFISRSSWLTVQHTPCLSCYFVIILFVHFQLFNFSQLRAVSRHFPFAIFHWCLWGRTDLFIKTIYDNCRNFLMLDYIYYTLLIILNVTDHLWVCSFTLCIIQIVILFRIITLPRLLFIFLLHAIRESISPSALRSESEYLIWVFHWLFWPFFTIQHLLWLYFSLII